MKKKNEGPHRGKGKAVLSTIFQRKNSPKYIESKKEGGAERKGLCFPSKKEKSNGKENPLHGRDLPFLGKK